MADAAPEGGGQGMSAPSPILEVRLKVPLDRFELDVDFATHARVTGIFGVSGSGKTTLLETIAGLRRGACGVIRCGGESWLDSTVGLRLPPEHRGIGYVPQQHLIFPHMGVRGNLLAGAARARGRGGDAARTFESVVEVLELGPLLGRGVGELSGGERQRVALGRALCSGPRLLLLDEPLASLDVSLRSRILPFLRRVRDSFGLPILVVSHSPTELQALCDELIALRRGRVIASGAPMDVLTRPDLFHEAESQGFKNILPCRVEGHDTHGSRLRLGREGGGALLRVPRCETAPGEQVFAGIAASDILLALAAPKGLSARNNIPGRIERVSDVDHACLLTVVIQKGMPPIAVEVTPDASAELQLAAGTEVTLVIKSSSISVYPSADMAPAAAARLSS